MTQRSRSRDFEDIWDFPYAVVPVRNVDLMGSRIGVSGDVENLRFSRSDGIIPDMGISRTILNDREFV